MHTHIPPSALGIALSCPASARHLVTSSATPAPAPLPNPIPLSYIDTVEDGLRPDTVTGIITHRLYETLFALRHAGYSVVDSDGNAVSESDLANIFPAEYPVASSFASWCTDVRRSHPDPCLCGISVPTRGAGIVGAGIIDYMCVHAEDGGIVLTIVDLKCGPRAVTESAQMLAYASAKWTDAVIRADLVVYQAGEAYTMTVTLDDILDFRRRVSALDPESNTYTPSNDVCRYCPASTTCLHRLRHCFDTAFAGLLEGDCDDLGDCPNDVIESLLTARESITAMCDGIKHEAYIRTISGRLPGYHAQNPQRSIAARYHDEVVARLSADTGIDEDEVRSRIYRQPKINLSAVDRITGGKQETQRIIGDIITETKPEGVFKSYTDSDLRFAK